MRGASPPSLAPERHEEIERTARTAHPTEAVRDVTTGDDGAQLALDVPKIQAMLDKKK